MECWGLPNSSWGKLLASCCRPARAAAWLPLCKLGPRKPGRALPASCKRQRQVSTEDTKTVR